VGIFHEDMNDVNKKDGQILIIILLLADCFGSEGK